MLQNQIKAVPMTSKWNKQEEIHKLQIANEGNSTKYKKIMRN